MSRAEITGGGSGYIRGMWGRVGRGVVAEREESEDASFSTREGGIFPVSWSLPHVYGSAFMH